MVLIALVFMFNTPWTFGLSSLHLTSNKPLFLTKSSDDPTISAIENRLVALIRDLRKETLGEKEQLQLITQFSEKAAHICPNFEWTNLFTTEGSILALYVRKHPDEALEMVAFLGEIQRILTQQEITSTLQEIQSEELIKLLTKLYMTANGAIEVNDQIKLTLSDIAPNFDQQLLKSRLHPHAFYHYVHNHSDEAAQLIRWLKEEFIANRRSN